MKSNPSHKRLIRHIRVRRKIAGIQAQPRLSVFRSNKHIYAQIIDDESQRTLMSYSDSKLKTAKSGEAKKLGKRQTAYEVGFALAKNAHGKKIKKVRFDRGGYKYHGRIKSLAEGARKGGLIF